jgi:predicted secreted protein
LACLRHLKEQRVATGIRKSNKRAATKATVLFVVLAAGLATASCASKATGAAAKSTSTSSHLVALTASDSTKTIKVHVPAKITLTLAYDPSSGMVWELQSGGAGFSMPRPPVFDDPGSGATSGSEVLTFSMKAKGTLPVVLDYMVPGPISGTPKQFSLTLEGT